jgi:hypothetical protein
MRGVRSELSSNPAANARGVSGFTLRGFLMAGYRKWNGSIYNPPDKSIRTDPANDNYGRADDLPPGAKPRKSKPAASTRKERPTAPTGPEEVDDGYWQSLLS